MWGDVIRGTFVRSIVSDKPLKFRDHFREIPPESIGGGIFDSYFRYNLLPEVDTDVISDVAVVCRCGFYRSNGSRDI